VIFLFLCFSNTFSNTFQNIQLSIPFESISFLATSRCP
jgi:hypothetical protein